MLEELGRLITAAFAVNRQTAERWAALIIGGQTGEAARELVRAYIRGRQVGYAVHGATLGLPRSVPARVVRRWREAGLLWANAIQTRVLQTFDARDDVTALFVRSYAVGVTTQATWSGQDEMFRDLGTATSVEFKRWVRAWPREEHRDWHDDLNDVVIPVDDLFTLPGGPNAGSQVYGPRDWDKVGDPAEHMNCGHALAFETAPTASDVQRADAVVYDPRNQPRTRAGERSFAPPSRPAPRAVPPEERADVWSPTKTPEAAEAFAQESAYREPAYHVTTEANAAAIQRQGFQTNPGGFGQIHGQGVYLALDDRTTEYYVGLAGRRNMTPNTLTVRANVRRPLDVTMPRNASGGDVVDVLVAYDESRGIASGLVRTADMRLRVGGVAEPGSLAAIAEERINQALGTTNRGARWSAENSAVAARIVSEVVQEAGFDAIRIRSDQGVGGIGGNQLVVFDPRKVVVVRGR